jgi:hypothetical protein
MDWQGSQPGLSGEKPGPNRLSHGKVYKGFISRPI